MKAIKEKVQREIVFYLDKLPRFKQIEALDFIKWLWGGPSTGENFNREEINKIESLAKKKGGKKFKNWKDAKKYLEDLMQ